jgi:hypothetical protein
MWTISYGYCTLPSAKTKSEDASQKDKNIQQAGFPDGHPL